MYSKQCFPSAVYSIAKPTIMTLHVHAFSYKHLDHSEKDLVRLLLPQYASGRSIQQRYSIGFVIAVEECKILHRSRVLEFVFFLIEWSRIRMYVVFETQTQH